MVHSSMDAERLDIPRNVTPPPVPPPPPRRRNCSQIERRTLPSTAGANGNVVFTQVVSPSDSPTDSLLMCPLCVVVSFVVPVVMSVGHFLGRTDRLSQRQLDGQCLGNRVWACSRNHVALQCADDSEMAENNAEKPRRFSKPRVCIKNF
jgi:hypothetical protein